jgi:hypothetical protein
MTEVQVQAPNVIPSIRYQDARGAIDQPSPDG